jgi:hypothetical protein
MIDCSFLGTIRHEKLVKKEKGKNLLLYYYNVKFIVKILVNFDYFAGMKFGSILCKAANFSIVCIYLDMYCAK